jgi:hypothetical protein
MQQRCVTLLRFTWILDSLSYVYCCAAALDMGFAPGRTASFEAGVLAVVVFLLAILGLLASISPRILIRTYLLALERFIGKGVLNVLLGAVTFTSAIPWRAACSFATIAFGFAWCLVSFFMRDEVPRSLLGCGQAAPPPALTSAAAPPPPPAAGAGAPAQGAAEGGSPPAAASAFTPGASSKPFNPFLA